MSPREIWTGLPKKAVLDLLIEQAEAAEATLIMVTHDHSLLGRFSRVMDFQELVIK